MQRFWQNGTWTYRLSGCSIYCGKGSVPVCPVCCPADLRLKSHGSARRLKSHGSAMHAGATSGTSVPVCCHAVLAAGCMVSWGEAFEVDIILASRNPGKRQEFEQIFALYGASHLRLVSPGAGAPHVAETGRSYRANARLKAEAFASHYTSAALGDDSGLVVDALQGAPGLRTARFGGPGLDDAQRVELLLDRLRGVPPQPRGPHFACALCLAYPDGT